MTTTHSKYRKNHHDGAPLLDSVPFIMWLYGFNQPASELARALGVDEGRMRRVLSGERVSERFIERAGIELTDDPRLAARLYPELDY